MDLKQVLKVATGVVIVPLAIGAHTLWPWWSRQTLPIKIVTGIVVLPFVGVSALLSTWWNNY